MRTRICTPGAGFAGMELSTILSQTLGERLAVSREG
jgi:hypothetical protein